MPKMEGGWVRRAWAAVPLGLPMLLVAGLVLVTLNLRNPGNARGVMYDIFRDVAKRNMLLFTSTWPTAESQHFVLRYRPEDGAVAPLVLETAEEVYEGVTGLLGYRPGRKVPVVMYPDRLSLGRSFGWAGDESAMGVYWAGVIRVLSPADWLRGTAWSEMSAHFKAKGPMAHELAHLLVDYRARGNYPRWLTEGIAQYVEREVVGFEFPLPPERGEWYPLGQMDKTFDALPDQSLAYHQSLLMVDYLAELKGYPVLMDMLDLLGAGLSLEWTMVQLYGLDMTGFWNGFQTWAAARN